MSSKGFIRESPLITAKRYALRDLQNNANASELRWLNNNLIMWLRALTTWETDTNNQIAKSKTDVAKLVPAPNEDPSKAYLLAKSNFIAKRTKRLHFLQIVKNKKEEVKALIGSDTVITKMTMGDLVGLMLEIDELVKASDTVELRRMVNSFIKLWTTEMLEGNNYDKEKS